MTKHLEHVYSDGVVGVYIDGVVVHIDFGEKENSQQSAADKDNKVAIKETLRVTLPLVGFLQTVGVVQQLVGDDKFVNIVKRLQDAQFIPKGDPADSSKEKK